MKRAHLSPTTRRAVRIALSVLGASLAVAAPARADPPQSPPALVRIPSPPMLCAIGPEALKGSEITCQTSDFGGFPVPGHPHQSVFTAAGVLTYQDANLPTGGDDVAPPTLTEWQTHRINGWSILPTDRRVTFTSDAFQHGVTVDADLQIHTF